MSLSFANAVRRDLGIGVLLIGFVCLVTFMFSFLGTILCATMFGMMAGVGKGWKWRTLLLSLLFPAMLLLSMHYRAQSGPLTRSFGLASVCFGSFWGVYLATRGVLMLEGGRQEPLPPQPRARPTPVQSWHNLEIQELQGTWAEKDQPINGAERKIIKVDGEEMTVTLVGVDGASRIVAKGRVHISKSAHA